MSPRFFPSLISSFFRFSPDSSTLRSLFSHFLTTLAPFYFLYFSLSLSVFNSVCLMSFFVFVLFLGFECDGERRMLILTFCRLGWDGDPLSCEVYGLVSVPKTLPHLVCNKKWNIDFKFHNMMKRNQWINYKINFSLS